MDFSALKAEAAKLPGTEIVYQPDWEAEKLLVGGKMYAMLAEYKDTGRPIFTFKLPPERGDFLRRQYSSITPGYYMNKLHLNTAWLDTQQVPDAELLALLREAHATGLAALSAKARRAVLEGAPSTK